MKDANLQPSSLQYSSFLRKEGAKQAALILMKNSHFNRTPLYLLFFFAFLKKGGLSFWLCGYALAFGSGVVIGTEFFAGVGLEERQYAHMFFQVISAFQFIGFKFFN